MAITSGLATPARVAHSETSANPCSRLSFRSYYSAWRALLSDGIVQIESEDWLVKKLIELGPSYFGLLRHIQWNFVSPQTLVDVLRTHGTIPGAESLWESLHAFTPPLFAIPRSIDSTIVSALPRIFPELQRKQFTLLYRGSRDGFTASRFHDRCDGHMNTLTLIRNIQCIHLEDLRH
jgi:hypothetical protein